MPAGRIEATIVRPPQDTARLELPGPAQRCGDGHAVLLQGISPDGQGVLVRLRFADSLVSGAYPLRGPGDTTTPGSIGAIRYQVRDVTHSFELDSCAFEVTRGRNEISARATTSGLENAVRVHATVEMRDLPILSDTIPCRDAP